MVVHAYNPNEILPQKGLKKKRAVLSLAAI
jgi:hypothetical protein